VENELILEEQLEASRVYATSTQYMELTSRDLRVIELMNQYERQDLEFNLRELHNLVDTLLYLNETLQQEQTPIQAWQKYSETLLFKFSLHALTLHDILSGLILKSSYFPKQLNGVKVIDISSAKVVLRSQIETLLMYHHIYVNAIDDDQKQLRYYAWVYSALLQRKAFPTSTEQGQLQKANDQAEIEKLKTIIEGLISFKKLSQKQQIALLDSGSGKLFSHWGTILKETGFSEKHAISIMYTYLSMYSHSEGLSAIQLNAGMFRYEKNKKDANLDLHTSKLLVCLMIRAIVDLFKAIEIRYKTLDENLQTDIEFYSKSALTVED
jgi:hypothetical protein